MFAILSCIEVLEFFSEHLKFGLKTSGKKFRLVNLRVFLKIKNLLNGTFKKNSVQLKVSQFYVDSKSRDGKQF